MPPFAEEHIYHRKGRPVHLKFARTGTGTETDYTTASEIPEEHIEHLTFAERQARKTRLTFKQDVFPMGTQTETESPGFSSRRPFPEKHIMRRRLPTVSEKRHRRYQKQRAKEDKKAAAPVVQAQPQIIILPGSGGGRQGPPGPPGAPGAAGGGGGASGAAAAAAASGAGAAGAGGARKPEKKKRRKASGITKAKKRYTDQRKIKMAEMRSLKSKRIREFAARTKKMPKKNRDEARKAYAAKANARYREMSTKFPPARGLKDLQSVLQLIAKLDTVRMAQ